MTLIFIENNPIISQKILPQIKSHFNIPLAYEKITSKAPISNLRPHPFVVKIGKINTISACVFILLHRRRQEGTSSLEITQNRQSVSRGLSSVRSVAPRKAAKLVRSDCRNGSRSVLCATRLKVCVCD